VTKTSRYWPSGNEVMSAFPDVATAEDRPKAIGPILMHIANWYLQVNVNEVGTARGLVSEPKTREMLDNLVLAGRLNQHTGEWWRKHGVTFYDQMDGVTYWCTPKHEQKLLDAAMKAREAAQLAQARAWAHNQLAQEHPERYRQLVEQRLGDLQGRW
jgi:hypothetical protein